MMDVEVAHFWDMAREIRAYCKETGLRVVPHDDPMKRTLGFETECPKEDSRHRDWRIRLTVLSMTANRREGGYDGGSEEDMMKLVDMMRLIEGRNRVAEVFSTGWENG